MRDSEASHSEPSVASASAPDAIELKACAIRAAISSARCILEIESQSWATTSCISHANRLIVAETAPLVIRAINELESCLTPAIARQAVRAAGASTAQEWTTFVLAAWPHAAAVKQAVIEMGDTFESGMIAARLPEKCSGLAQMSPGGERWALIEQRLQVVLEGLIQLYGLLCLGSSTVLPKLVNSRSGTSRIK